MDTIASDMKKTRFRNKSDSYSLLTYLAGKAERLKLDDAQAAALVTSAREFSELVNSIKRLEAAQASTASLARGKLGPSALIYLRAVERAASDRLSRVRRAECLEKVFGPIIDGVEPVELTQEDGVWALAVDDEPEDDADNPEQTLSETHGVQEALLSDGNSGFEPPKESETSG